jgi:uncharacterized integral membrane protein
MPKSHTMKIFKKIVLALLLLLILIFASQNFESVEVNLFSWSVQLPIAVTLIGVYLLGAITGSLTFSLFRKVTSPGPKKPVHP